MLLSFYLMWQVWEWQKCVKRSVQRESRGKNNITLCARTQCIKRRHWDNYQAASCQVAAQKGGLAMQTNTLGCTAFRRTTHTHAPTVQIKTMAARKHKRLRSKPRRESGGSVSGRRAGGRLDKHNNRCVQPSSWPPTEGDMWLDLQEFNIYRRRRIFAVQEICRLGAAFSSREIIFIFVPQVHSFTNCAS